MLNTVFHTLQNIQTGSEAHPVSLSMCTGVKQFRCEVNHSPTSSGQVKNEGRYSSTSPYAFMVYRGIPLLFNLSRIM